MPSYKHQVVLSCKQRKRRPVQEGRSFCPKVSFWQTKTVLKVR